MTRVQTTDKALAVLRLFSEEEPQWSVEAAAERLGVPASTAYRYFRSLAGAGLVVAFGAGLYVIGPGVIELDRMARRTDPLILAAQEAMDELSAKAPTDHIVLLSRLYRRQVMCVDQREHGRHFMDVSYERGRPMPLYRGSVSKVILANLSARTLSRYFDDDYEEIKAAGLPTELKAFRKELREIRRQGFYVSRGEVDPGVIGISAPILSPDEDALASISLVLPDTPKNAKHSASFAEPVMEAADTISMEFRQFTA